MKTVAVLFARRDSFYKSQPECDVFDVDRDARNYEGPLPVIAHPPCRAWGELSHLAKPVPGEKELALFAVDIVRKYGGCLEHPKKSKLWDEYELPAIGEIDSFGGWILPIAQSDFGHKAEKKTFLYIVGIRPAELPVFDIMLGRATHVIAQSGRRRDGSRIVKGDPRYRPQVSKAEREHTPARLGKWLIDLANLCGGSFS
jgi:hypothetical protein